MNAIVQNVVDDIHQEDENKNLSETIEPQEYENIDSEIYEKDLYEMDKLSLDDSQKIVMLTCILNPTRKQL